MKVGRFSNPNQRLSKPGICKKKSATSTIAPLSSPRDPQWVPMNGATYHIVTLGHLRS